jgi:hypothetical protein
MVAKCTLLKWAMDTGKTRSIAGSAHSPELFGQPQCFIGFERNLCLTALHQN